MRIKCLIVDDEPIARQILERYCAVLPDLEVLAGCSNPLEAKRLLESRGLTCFF
jgi:DNA-binding LytR/AlgR family response regulator